MESISNVGRKEGVKKERRQRHTPENRKWPRTPTGGGSLFLWRGSWNGVNRDWRERERKERKHGYRKKEEGSKVGEKSWSYK